MEKVQSLQDMINQKAEKRLDKDIKDLSDYIRGNPLMRPTDNPGLPSIYLQSATGEYLGKKPFWFFDVNSSRFFDFVKDFWLPIYIAEETKMFVEKVEEIKEYATANTDE